VTDCDLETVKIVRTRKITVSGQKGLDQGRPTGAQKNFCMAQTAVFFENA
jgi:hypothetical protein